MMATGQLATDLTTLSNCAAEAGDIAAVEHRQWRVTAFTGAQY